MNSGGRSHKQALIEIAETAWASALAAGALMSAVPAVAMVTWRGGAGSFEEPWFWDLRGLAPIAGGLAFVLGGLLGALNLRRMPHWLWAVAGLVTVGGSIARYSGIPAYPLAFDIAFLAAIGLVPVAGAVGARAVLVQRSSRAVKASRLVMGLIAVAVAFAAPYLHKVWFP